MNRKKFLEGCKPFAYHPQGKRAFPILYFGHNSIRWTIGKESQRMWAEDVWTKNVNVMNLACREADEDTTVQVLDMVTGLHYSMALREFYNKASVMNEGIDAQYKVARSAFDIVRVNPEQGTLFTMKASRKRTVGMDH